MKRKVHKSLSVLLALVMVAGIFTTAPLTANAATENIVVWNATSLTAAPSQSATYGTGTLSHSSGTNIGYSSSGYHAANI